MHKDAHGAKEMQLKLSQQLFNCDYVKGDFDEDRKVGDGICGMMMLKQNMGEKTGRINRNSWSSRKTVEIIESKLFMQV